jgi:hypothetical protein
VTQVTIDLQELLAQLREQFAQELVRMHTDLAVARLETKKLREMLEAEQAKGKESGDGSD